MVRAIITAPLLIAASFLFAACDDPPEDKEVVVKVPKGVAVKVEREEPEERVIVGLVAAALVSASLIAASLGVQRA